MTQETTVAIIGGGPAGLAAALQLRKQGIDGVTVLERDDELGGVPRMCHHIGFGIRDLRRLYTGPQYAHEYAKRVREAGVTVRTSTMATGWADADAMTLNVTSPRGRDQITAEAILLATGCRERPRHARLIPGSRPAGVYTTGSLQQFAYRHNHPVGRRAVVVGAELVSFSAVLTLVHAGVSVAMMTTALPSHQAYFPYLPVKWYAVDLIGRTSIRTRTGVSRIIGRDRVEAVEITDLDSGQSERVACDTVVFTGDWIPEQELACSGGVAVNAETRGPTVDSRLHTSRPGIFAAGNVLRGAETADIAALEGRHAALHIHDFLTQDHRNGCRLAIEPQLPIVWITPNSISPARRVPPRERFLFRVNDTCDGAHVRTAQGDRVLYNEHFRRLRPNMSARLSSAWVEHADLTGEPVRIEIT